VEEKLLIKQAKSGNKESLLKLVMIQENDYYKLAYVYMKNPDDSMDVMQDMIIILYENITKLKKDSSFYSWSKTILVNLCKKRLKEKQKIVSIDSIKEQSIDGIYDNSEDSVVLEKYLSKLNENHKEIIKLKYYLDLDYKTISEILKIPLGTVKSRLSIGMKELKEAMGGEILE
jgi:RNA polymerase sigma-70 factor (ECF subfamily)